MTSGVAVALPSPSSRSMRWRPRGRRRRLLIAVGRHSIGSGSSVSILESSSGSGRRGGTWLFKRTAQRRERRVLAHPLHERKGGELEVEEGDAHEAAARCGVVREAAGQPGCHRRLRRRRSRGGQHRRGAAAAARWRSGHRSPMASGHEYKMGTPSHAASPSRRGAPEVGGRSSPFTGPRV